MTRTPIARLALRPAVAFVLIVGALIAFIWGLPMAAGGVQAFLAAEDSLDRSRWALAALVSPVLALFVARTVWRAWRWRGLAMYVENGRLWLLNRWRPIRLDNVREVQVDEAIELWKGYTAWPAFLILVRTDGSRVRAPITRAVESPEEIADRLRACLESRRESPESGGLAGCSS